MDSPIFLIQFHCTLRRWLWLEKSVAFVLCATTEMESPHKRIKLEHAAPSPPAPAPAAIILNDDLAATQTPAQDDSVDLLPEDKQYRRRYLLRGHSKAVSSVKFSPDGKYLASACISLSLCERELIVAADKLIKLWDSRTGEFIQNFEGHTKGISDIAWSSNSTLLASASDDKTVRLWDVNTVLSYFWIVEILRLRENVSRL